MQCDVSVCILRTCDGGAIFVILKRRAEAIADDIHTDLKQNLGQHLSFDLQVIEEFHPIHSFSVRTDLPVKVSGK